MSNLTNNITYTSLKPEHYQQVITLANLVHGEHYLTVDKLKQWVYLGIKDSLNCSFVAELNGVIIGFRITFSANNWPIDQWCTPNNWLINQKQCCYFKCNTVDENYRGLGIGKHLLSLSISVAKQQGALAGISHLWRESPNNSAVLYFTHCGGKLIKYHQDKWYQDSKSDYSCILCGHDCHCNAAEMIIYFNE